MNISEGDSLKAGLAAYDRGWMDCLNTLRCIPIAMLPQVIENLLKTPVSK